MFAKVKRVLKKDLTDEELERKIANLNMEKQDYRAMVIAALLVFMPIVIFIALIFYFVIWLFFL